MSDDITDNYNTMSRQRQKVSALLVAGHTIDEIKEICDFSNVAINDYFIEIRHKARSNKRNLKVSDIHFGGKNEPYYPASDFSEQDLADLKFDYSEKDLSKDEKKIFDSLTLAQTETLWGLTIKQYLLTI